MRLNYIIDYVLSAIFFTSGFIIHYKLSKKGYGGYIRVLGAALGLYLGPLACIMLFFMKGKNKDE
jgi:uncharacterized membrane protein required for colicin V production